MSHKEKRRLERKRQRTVEFRELLTPNLAEMKDHFDAPSFTPGVPPRRWDKQALIAQDE